MGSALSSTHWAAEYHGVILDNGRRHGEVLELYQVRLARENLFVSDRLVSVRHFVCPRVHRRSSLRYRRILSYSAFVLVRWRAFPPALTESIFLIRRMTASSRAPAGSGLERRAAQHGHR